MFRISKKNPPKYTQNLKYVRRRKNCKLFENLREKTFVGEGVQKKGILGFLPLLDFSGATFVTLKKKNIISLQKIQI